MNDAIIKLKRLKNKIETMPDNYQKALFVTNYFRLYSFLTDSGLIKENDTEYFLEADIDGFVKNLCKDNINYVSDLTKNNKRLLEICMELKDVYSTGNWNKRRIKEKINQKKAEILLETFLKYLGSDVFKLYEELKENNIHNLAVNIHETDGACYGMNGEKYAYINVKMVNNNLESCISLVHEIGHAYHFYLTRNHGKTTNFNVNVEVMSLLFEKLFIKFLENSYECEITQNSQWYNYHHSQFWILMETLITSSLLAENKISYINHALDCKTNYSDFELIAFAENLGYDSDTIPDLTLDGYYYIIGNIVSDYFLKQMKEDYQKGFKEVCNFIQEASFYSISEILDKYASDLGYTKDNIRNVIKNGRSYQKRK